MSYSKLAQRGILAVFIGTCLLAGAGEASAQDHRGPERREHARERDIRAPYRVEHWNYDNRHNHRHYYPSVGYIVTAPPPGGVSVNYGHRRFFFHSGVWYEPAASGYVVARPPIGIVVPSLPPDNSMLWVGSVPYYYANDVYYTAAPGGYVVTAPPETDGYSEQPPTQLPQGMPPDSGGQPSGGTWYFCASQNAYYPYVANCPEGWQPVPATAPPNR